MSEPIDLAYGHYGLSKQVYKKLQELNQAHLDKHPTCEICLHNPSVRITPIGFLRAACLECIADMRRQVDEEIQDEIERDAGHPYY